MEGYLLKEGAGLVKGYRKRYFQIQGHYLVYFKVQGDVEPVGSINLRSLEITDNDQQQFGFALTSPGLPRAYNLAALSEEDKLVWMKHLSDASQNAPEKDLSNDAEEIFSSATDGKKVGLQDFTILQVLGRGSFGKVLKVKQNGTDKIFAMKALRKDVVVREGMVRNTKAEKFILQTMHHPFIVKLHYAFQTADRLYLILDLLSGGELFFHLKTEGTFHVERARQYAAEIVSALAHLHKSDIVYRDLKPENIVIDQFGYACLTDFGLAKTNILEKEQTHTFCGTPEYIAPEILKGIGHGKAVDWWALGVLLFEMIAGLPPFYSEEVDEMYQLILTKPLEFPEGFPSDCADLVEKFLQRDPEKRLVDGDVIKAHPFFSTINFTQLENRQITPFWVPDLSQGNDIYLDDEFRDEAAKLSQYQSNQKQDEASWQGFTCNVDH